MSITYFLCNLNKKILDTVVLLLVLKFWSVKYMHFTDTTQKIIWKYWRIFIYYLLLKLGVKITNCYKKFGFLKKIWRYLRNYTIFPLVQFLTKKPYFFSFFFFCFVSFGFFCFVLDSSFTWTVIYYLNSDFKKNRYLAVLRPVLHLRGKKYVIKRDVWIWPVCSSDILNI